MGIRGGRDSGHSPAAISYRPHASGCGSNAVPDPKISNRSRCGARHPLQHPGLSWIPLRPAHRELFCAVLLACSHRPHRLVSGDRLVWTLPIQTSAEGRTPESLPPATANSATDGLIFPATFSAAHGDFRNNLYL